ncbi:Peroxidase 4 [Nymphaea thermarum]|nr:Peroxidase 4 [Nymphaea thermarum]
MASASLLLISLYAIALVPGTSSAQLTTDFYDGSCPDLLDTIRSQVESEIAKEKRMGASLLRLFFHDCFVNGCDGSIFLDDTPTFIGEKNAGPNRNSARGFEVIDAIKTAVEEVCPETVSCADVLAVTARDAVAILGGLYWDVKLGRRDARTASQAAANTSIPPPTSSLSQLISSFQAQDLSTNEMVALAGAHTIGQARCTNFRNRIYNETNLDAFLASTWKAVCPSTSGVGDNNLAPLDLQTPTFFDNNYYRNLIYKRGLLHSDQQLFSGGPTDSLVKAYSEDGASFHSDFVGAMIKMGDIKPLTGSGGDQEELQEGELRRFMLCLVLYYLSMGIIHGEL